MGTGWRRVFCTAIPRERLDRDPRHNNPRQQQESSGKQSPSCLSSSPSSRSCAKLSFFSTFSSSTTTPSCLSHLTLSTPSLPTTSTEQLPFSSDNNTPELQCKTGHTTKLIMTSSNPSSPHSPFSILMHTLRLSRNGCRVCLKSIKTGQAMYTAECSHSFHFPCISAHVQKQGSLVCPVCTLTWKDFPLHSTNLKRIQSSVSTLKMNRAFQFKPYNDDESLFSQSLSTCTRFNTIPEEEQDMDQEQQPHEPTDQSDVEEFQGFFVDSTTPNSPRKKTRNRHNIVYVKFVPEAAAVVSVGRTHETFAVALKVKAQSAHAPPPLLSPSHRAAIDLVAVLDIGGSLSSEKLQMLKQAMLWLISSLGSSDRLSIVVFSATSLRLLPLRRMTAHGQRSAGRIVGRLVCGQGDCRGEALRKASKVLEDRREKNPVASIVMLSDKKPQGGTGLSDHQRPLPCHVASIRFAHVEIPAAEEEDAFARCVRALLSVVVQDLRIQLGFASGSTPAEIMAVYSSTSTGRPALLSCDSPLLGDLYADEERELLVELKVPTTMIGFHHVMAVRCSYRDPTTQKLICCRERALLVPRPHAVRSDDPRIERLRKRFVTTRAVAESWRLVEHGDFASAHHLLWSARAVVTRSGSGTTRDEFARPVETALAEMQVRLRDREVAAKVRRRRRSEKEVEVIVDEYGEAVTPMSAWKAAEQLAKVAMMKKKSLNKVSDLHGFENARF